MQRFFVLAAVAAVFLAPALLRADDAITIKIRDTAEGDVQQIKKTETTDATNKITDATGKAVVDAKSNTVNTSVYKETILKCEAKKSPTKLERTYEKATVTTDGKETALAYQGKTVLIEKKDGKFHFSIDGKDLSDQDAAPLAAEFGKDRDSRDELEKALLPKKPVKVNDSWEVDMKPFLKDIAKDGAMEVDTDKSKGSATLAKAYKKNDKQYGVIKMTLTLPIKSMGQGEQKIVTDGKSNMVMEIDLDTCIDGSVADGAAKMSMKMDVKGSGTFPNVGKLDVDVSIHAKSEEVSKEAPKK